LWQLSLRDSDQAHALAVFKVGQLVSMPGEPHFRQKNAAIRKFFAPAAQFIESVRIHQRIRGFAGYVVTARLAPSFCESRVGTIPPNMISCYKFQEFR
jgi:hypothetical protein